MIIDDIFNDDNLKKEFQNKFYKEREDLDKYVLVRLVDYCQENNELKSNKQNNVKGKLHSFLGDIEVLNARDTIHFTVNGHVTSHSLGNWDIRKYAIIIPFKEFLDKNKERVVLTNVEDFYVRNNVQLPENAIILAPTQEIEEVQSKNQNVNVIGYNGDNVVPYVDKLLEMMGYQTYKIGEHGYYDFSNGGYAYDFQKQFDSDMKNLNIQNDLHDHDSSFDNDLETVIIRSEFVHNFLKKLKETYNNIPYDQIFNMISNLKISSTEDYINFESENISSKRFFDNLNVYGKNSVTSRDFFSNLNIYKRNSMTSNINDAKNQNMLKEYLKERDKFLTKVGLSNLDLEELASDEKYKRIMESFYIDDYLNKDISDYNENDIVVANTDRLIDLVNKMAKENSKDNSRGKTALKMLTNHLYKDLVVRNDDYKKMLEYKGINYNEQEKLINDKLSLVGLSIEDFKHNTYDLSESNNNNDYDEEFYEEIKEVINEFTSKDKEKYNGLDDVERDIEIIKYLNNNQISNEDLFVSCIFDMNVNLVSKREEYLNKFENKELKEMSLDDKLSDINCSLNDFKKLNRWETLQDRVTQMCDKMMMEGKKKI